MHLLSVPMKVYGPEMHITNIIPLVLGIQSTHLAALNGIASPHSIHPDHLTLALI